MGRDGGRITTSPRPTGFNPRARMGRDARGGGDIGCERVSIHAPVWGATAIAREAGISIDVSIHAPVWGATRGGGKYFSVAEFQSTRPYGARPRCPRKCMLTCPFQSTRPYGARRAGRPGMRSDNEFQSTRPYGARQITSRCSPGARVSIHAPVWGATRSPAWNSYGSWFQSTRPYGARRQ